LISLGGNGFRRYPNPFENDRSSNPRLKAELLYHEALPTPPLRSNFVTISPPPRKQEKGGRARFSFYLFADS